MRLDHIAPVQKRHLPVRLHPDLVARVRRDDVQRRDVQAEFARLGEFAEAGAEGEEIGARDAGREVGEGKAHVVDARGVEAEDVSVVGGGGGRGVGAGGGGWCDEVGERAAGVVGEFGEEGLRLGFGEGTHDGGRFVTGGGLAGCCTC